MTETLTQPQIPPREDDDEPCGLTKGQIRALCEPRVPPDFLKQNPSPYSLLVGAVNRREQELAFAEIGQEQLIEICNALEVKEADVAKRASEALKNLRDRLKQLATLKKSQDDHVPMLMLLKAVDSAIGTRGASLLGIEASANELSALLNLGLLIVRRVREEGLCISCSSKLVAGGKSMKHEAECPIGAYEALPKHGDLQTYKMKSIWESKRLSRAFQLRTESAISVRGQIVRCKEGEWVITPDHGGEPVIMTDALFRSMFELVP